MKKRTKALQFDKKTAERIYNRDNGCLFCKIHYRIEKYESTGISDIMHIVNKSQGGLGIEENGLIGCRYHHSMYDNGNNGARNEMDHIIDDYMQSQYEDWNREKLVYRKWV